MSRTDLVPKLKKVKRTTLTESITVQILNMVENGEFKEGQRLPSEREMAEMLSVSRASVREAMRALQSMGVVDIRSGSGTFLSTNSNKLSDFFGVRNIIKKYSFLDLNEARKVLEVEIAGLAALRATDENKEMIVKAHRKALDIKDRNEKLLKADYNLHLAIAEASQNEFLVEMLNMVKDLLIEANLEMLKVPNQVECSMQYHERIVNHILEGNVKQARTAMREHLEDIEKTIQKLFDPSTGPT
jgi:GntR family transcriptional repressor for pyruvate dehydrogenase complex